MAEESLKYVRDYHTLYKDGKLVHLVGRDREVSRLQQIMQRLLKNNPMLIGPIGVGKTAILEGFAAHLAKGTVLPSLKGMRLVDIDLASILLDYPEGAELENVFKAIFQSIEKSKGKDVLVIKDLSYLTGHKEETKEISKFLAPKVVSGKIRCLVATDLSQYKIYIETNADLMRAFQTVYVEEPSMAETVKIVDGIKEKFEKFYNVKISEETIKASVNLTQRFVKQRLFPEKAIDLLDEAASLLLMEQHLGKTKDNTLTPAHLNSVVAFWTGIPLDKVDSRDKERLLQMENFLRQRVIGQDEAVEVVSGAVRRSRSGLQDPNRPIGTFFFIGTTGVGKTELAKALAEFVFDDETALLRLDMSEFMERSSVARMVGPPPGQPGYEMGGLLTEAVRLRPYQVVLFDELEKAHSEILNLLLQVLDEGRLTDGKGFQVDFRNTIIIMTSNLGANLPRYQRLDYLKTVMKPEFLARIDDIVPFHGLSEDMLLDIVGIHLGKMIKRAETIRLHVKITEKARGWLADEVFIAKNGVRELKRLMQHHIENPMSDMLMRDRLHEGDEVTVDLAENNKGLVVISPRGETLNSILEEESALDILEGQEKARAKLAQEQEEDLPEHLRSVEYQERMAIERAAKELLDKAKGMDYQVKKEIKRLTDTGFPPHLARAEALINLQLTEDDLTDAMNTAKKAYAEAGMTFPQENAPAQTQKEQTPPSFTPPPPPPAF